MHFHYFECYLMSSTPGDRTAEPQRRYRAKRVHLNKYIIIRDLWGESPPKFWPSGLFYGTPTKNAWLNFKKEFSEIWGLCCFVRPNFSRKNLTKKLIHFWKFSQKFNVLSIKRVSNGNVWKDFDEIAHKAPNRPF